MDIIHGVSIISIGEAKGHNIFVDQQTLLEVKACAEQYSGGVKVNLDHGAGIADIVGFVNNFRIVGSQLLGDLNLLDSSPLHDYVMEIATKLPDTFGISISFSGGRREVGGLFFASCDELYSADLVQTPAANASGLFCQFNFTAKPVDISHIEMAATSPTTEMPETEMPETESEKPEIQVAIMDLIKRMDAMEASFYELQQKMAMPEEAQAPEVMPAEMCDCASNSIASKLEAKLDAIIHNFGAAPVKASVVAEEKKEVELSIKDLIKQKAIELGSRTEAILFAIRNHPEQYVYARDNNQLNF